MAGEDGAVREGVSRVQCAPRCSAAAQRSGR